MPRRALFLSLMTTLLAGITACGGSKSAPPLVTVAVTGSSATVPVNGFAFFSALVRNSSNQNVTWAVSGGAANGTISSDGAYAAPSSVPNPANVMITATSAADPAASATASITVTISFAVSPGAATVQAFGTTPFTAVIQGTSNLGVTWSVNGIVGGNSSVGTISAGGLYQAPESIPVNATSGDTTTVAVEGVPAADTAISGSATVTVTSANQKQQSTPILLGTSGGNINNENSTECASGTLGSLVTRNGTQFVLSNNHVLADSDAGVAGDAISQPGLIDAASPCVAADTTTVAHLSQFINIEAAAPPADAAIAQVVSGAVNTSGTIIQLGATVNGSGVPNDEAPSSTVLPVGSLMPNTTAVAKSGRSSGLTCSTIEATGITTRVQYNRGLGGPSFTATYTNQIAVNGGEFSAAGDSGSLIVAQATAEPVALLYAGSETDTIGAPVATVLANLADTATPPNVPSFVGTSDHVVAGCTSSGQDAFNATAQTSAAQPSAAELSKAEAARSQNAPTLMSDPAVLAIGVDGSLDRPNQSAVVLFVRKGQALVRPIPHSVGGVLTRVVAVNSLPKSGMIDQQSTAAFEKNAIRSTGFAPTPQQLADAKTTKEKYESSIMNEPGVLAIGVTSSLDNPSDAAILVFVEIGKAHGPIPLELDGIRVRVKSTDKFRAYGWGHPKAHPYRN